MKHLVLLFTTLMAATAIWNLSSCSANGESGTETEATEWAELEVPAEADTCATEEAAVEENPVEEEPVEEEPVEEAAVEENLSESDYKEESNDDSYSESSRASSANTWTGASSENSYKSMPWIQGNWKYRTVIYGNVHEMRVGIHEDYITVLTDGQMDYSGPYKIDGNHIRYGKEYMFYIVIDHNAQRLKISDNGNDYLQRF